ncbi:unknown similar to AMEV003 [Choristoneura rosaceana entomopoxvirus 'L']|uniref:Uncharacterized protein n=1 Tax=Choristoneura rosaceana entomopoxvirus 'L' TaxID=1293539 RepID=A0ABM9QKU2_9POXV|nr:unknown similar to AMEV003 [Choristoneura rosaceana entomopoxvirus 'L']CCU56163.1 unknown similar to AMEV003 [Choristoneura rosaceana entomopoxvirus 'L']
MHSIRYALIFTILYIIKNIKTEENLNNVIHNCVINNFNSKSCNNTQIYNKYIDMLNLSYNYNNNDDLDKITNVINLFNNLEYYNSYNPEKFISYMMHQVIHLNNFNEIVKKENIPYFNNLIKQLIDCYTKHNKLPITAESKNLLHMQELFNKFPIWFVNNERIIILIIYFYKYIRNIDNPHDFKNNIDNSTLQIIKIAIDNPNYIISEKKLKELFYIEYVSNIPQHEHYKFDNYYTILKKEDILPSIINYSINNINITFMYDKLSQDNIGYVLNETRYVYDNFIKFHNHLNLSIAFNNNEIYYHIFNDKRDYNKYGKLYNIETTNGGYTTNINNKIQSYIYIKEYYPYNFGHELYHALMFSVHNIDFPIWFKEGAASAYGNRECYENDYTYIKNNNFTINDALNSHYISDEPYFMGSSLIRFLYDTNPSIIKNILTYDFNKDWVNTNIEKQFIDWKNNNTTYCHKYNENKNKNKNKNIDNELPKIKNKYITNIIKYNIFDDFCLGNIIIEYYDEGEMTFILNKNNIYKLSDTNDNKYIFNYNNKTFVKDINAKLPTVTEYDYKWISYGLIKHLFKLYFKNYKYSDYIILNNDFSSYIYNSTIYCDNKIIEEIPIQSKFYKYICYEQDECIKNEYILVNEYIKNITNNNLCEYILPTVPLLNLPQNIIKLIYDLNMGNEINVNMIKNFNLKSDIDLHKNKLLDLAIKHNNKVLYDYIANIQNTNKSMLVSNINNLPYLCKYDIKIINNLHDEPGVIINKTHEPITPAIIDKLHNPNNKISKIYVNTINVEKNNYIVILIIILCIIIIIIIFLLYLNNKRH